ncbi:MAG: hypothetical protein EZS28_019508 [Streblomastix strix]|uniref:Uncharacterized protein n=1 Tax=Streblomastix strix TaxID=222440 RepID=A0A5J4VQZ4_9EUKA|nr:MAG: hypothetical protein EZS28_019508 [Streblomastix strix]
MTAISTLLISLGHPENKIYINTTSICTNKERKDTANRIQDRETYNLDDLLRYIWRRIEQINEMEQDELQRITIAQILTITTKKLAQLQRSASQVESLTSEQLVLQTDVDKVEGGNVFLTIQKAKDPAICPIHWFSHWWNIHKQRSNNGQTFWWDSSRNKPASTDECSQLVKLMIIATDLPY